MDGRACIKSGHGGMQFMCGGVTEWVQEVGTGEMQAWNMGGKATEGGGGGGGKSKRVGGEGRREGGLNGSWE